ncbi:MAG: preprotein translocase subunit SecG, partial [Candidatus Binatia bacterium]
MWYTVLIIVHVLACVFLTVVVLLQAGKGSDISAVFGGSSQTLFGSSGASTFLSKLTTWIAVVFMATS